MNNRVMTENDSVSLEFQIKNAEQTILSARSLSPKLANVFSSVLKRDVLVVMHRIFSAQRIPQSKSSLSPSHLISSKNNSKAPVNFFIASSSNSAHSSFSSFSSSSSCLDQRVNSPLSTQSRLKVNKKKDPLNLSKLLQTPTKYEELSDVSLMWASPISPHNPRQETKKEIESEDFSDWGGFLLLPASHSYLQNSGDEDVIESSLSMRQVSSTHENDDNEVSGNDSCGTKEEKDEKIDVESDRDEEEQGQHERAFKCLEYLCELFSKHICSSALIPPVNPIRADYDVLSPLETCNDPFVVQLILRCAWDLASKIYVEILTSFATNFDDVRSDRVIPNLLLQLETLFNIKFMEMKEPRSQNHLARTLLRTCLALITALLAVGDHLEQSIFLTVNSSLPITALPHSFASIQTFTRPLIKYLLANQNLNSHPLNPLPTSSSPPNALKFLDKLNVFLLENKEIFSVSHCKRVSQILKLKKRLGASLPLSFAEIYCGIKQNTFEDNKKEEQLKNEKKTLSHNTPPSRSLSQSLFSLLPSSTPPVSPHETTVLARRASLQKGFERLESKSTSKIGSASPCPSIPSNGSANSWLLANSRHISLHESFETRQASDSSIVSKTFSMNSSNLESSGISATLRDSDDIWRLCITCCSSPRYIPVNETLSSSSLNQLLYEIMFKKSNNTDTMDFEDFRPDMTCPSRGAAYLSVSLQEVINILYRLRFVEKNIVDLRLLFLPLPRYYANIKANTPYEERTDFRENAIYPIHQFPSCIKFSASAVSNLHYSSMSTGIFILVHPAIFTSSEKAHRNFAANLHKSLKNLIGPSANFQVHESSANGGISTANHDLRVSSTTEIYSLLSNSQEAESEDSSEDHEEAYEDENLFPEASEDSKTGLFSAVENLTQKIMKIQPKLRKVLEKATDTIGSFAHPLHDRSLNYLSGDQKMGGVRWTSLAECVQMSIRFADNLIFDSRDKKDSQNEGEDGKKTLGINHFLWIEEIQKSLSNATSTFHSSTFTLLSSTDRSSFLSRQQNAQKECSVACSERSPFTISHLRHSVSPNPIASPSSSDLRTLRFSVREAKDSSPVSVSSLPLLKPELFLPPPALIPQQQSYAIAALSLVSGEQGKSSLIALKCSFSPAVRMTSHVHIKKLFSVSYLSPYLQSPSYLSHNHVHEDETCDFLSIPIHYIRSIFPTNNPANVFLSQPVWTSTKKLNAVECNSTFLHELERARLVPPSLEKKHPFEPRAPASPRSTFPTFTAAAPIRMSASRLITVTFHLPLPYSDDLRPPSQVENLDGQIVEMPQDNVCEHSITIEFTSAPLAKAFATNLSFLVWSSRFSSTLPGLFRQVLSHAVGVNIPVPAVIDKQKSK
eukprot:GDKJ01023307.1.p1 GENE.GDKJ01023307.1~~GDKJ01023307.1.p1  ORF type:complete len:1590 (+),score=334.90 GDKJ01023307.1:694-4770(+)